MVTAVRFIVWLLASVSGAGLVYLFGPVIALMLVAFAAIVAVLDAWAREEIRYDREQRDAEWR